MYKVIRFFTDLQDNRHAYKAGDIFPRNGVEVSDERLEELAGKNNKRGLPLIELIPENTEAKAEAETTEATQATNEAENKPEKEPEKPKADKPKAKESKPKTEPNKGTKKGSKKNA